MLKHIVAGLSLLSLVTTALPVSAASLRSALRQQSDDRKAVAAYRLTKPTLDKVVLVMRAGQEEARKDPQVAELERVERDIAALEDKLQKSDLSAAERERLIKLEATRLGLARSAVRDEASASSIDELAEKVQKNPATAAALTRAGLTAREYATFMATFIHAALAHSLQQAGMPTLPEGVNPENVKFIAAHEAEVEAIQKEFQLFGRSGSRN
jgi:hypothetical protein